jgi:Peptidase of plants and bacteria
MSPYSRVLAAALFLAGTSRGAMPTKVHVTYSDAAVAPYASETRELCLQWYPKINDLLFGAGHPLPYQEVTVAFEISKYDAWSLGNAIHVSTEWLKNNPHHLDYRAVIIHELAHVNQDYRHETASWLTEGIADYVTYTYFTKDNEPRLHLDKDGYLYGYSASIPYLFAMQQAKMKPGPEGYKNGYTVASAFLLWLELEKDTNIVHKLNAALSEGTYSDEHFKEYCGAPLDALWLEFLAHSGPTSR